MRPVPAFAYHEPPPPSQDVVWRDPDGDLHSVCRRCGLRFNINRNNDYQCGLHPGYFNPKTRQYACCGVIDIDSPNIAPIFCTFKPHLA
jgi:ribosomal protein L37E